MSFRRCQSKKRKELVVEEIEVQRNNEQSKWRFLRQSFSVIRAIASSLTRVDDTKKTDDAELSLIASDSSYTAIDVELDKAVLDQLVEDRNFQRLEELGGVEGVAEALSASLADGLISDDVVASKRERFGENKFKNPPRRSFFGIVRSAVLDRNVVIMTACGALSLGLYIRDDGAKGARDSVSIFVAIYLAIGVVYVSEYWLEKVLAELHARENVLVDVVRGGHRQKIPMVQVVVGDVVFLSPGDLAPGHGLLVDNKYQNVKQPERGREFELKPIGQLPFILSGSKVVDGFAQMLVTSVGMNESKVNNNFRDETVLEVQLETLDNLKNLSCSVLIFFSLFFIKNNDNLAYVVAILVVIIMAVVDTPKSWKLSFSLTWACALKELIAQNALVLKRSALEALSYANTICIDATNKMKVVEYWFPSGEQILEGSAYEFLEEGTSLSSISDCLTRKAILSWVTKDLKMDVEKVKINCDIIETCRSNLDEEIIGILAKRKANGHRVQAHWFGAAEMILPMCSSFYDASGIVKDINDNQRCDFKDIIQGMEGRDRKCIAFAHKQIITKEFKAEHKLEEHKEKLTLLGVAVIHSICSTGVKDAVKACREAGVNVKMITEDSITVAKAIATKFGIVSRDKGRVIEGADFQKLLPRERMDEVDKICVMASSTASDKLLMLNCLKEKGQVLAIVNDARNYNESAVERKADVVISMGMQGIDAAESAGIVILDGNFSSIPKLLAWERCVSINIQKFLQFRLTVSLSALVVNFIGAFTKQGLSLTTIQLSWVNVVTNTLGAFAFSREKPTAHVMKKPPACKADPIITNIMLRNILPQTFYQIALLLAGPVLNSQEDDNVNLTLLFNTYLLCQVFNEFNSRELEKKNVFHGIHRNKFFLSIIAITVVLQVIFVEILKTLADTEMLTWPQWGLCAGIAFVTLPIGCITKLVPVSEKQVFGYVMVFGQIKHFIQRPILTKLRSFSIWTSMVLMRSNQRPNRLLRMTRHAEMEEQ